MNRLISYSCVFSILVWTGVAAGQSSSVTVNVPGTADPWLAGMPNGSSASCSLSTCDYAPGQSPVLVAGVTLTSGMSLDITATGGVSQDFSFPLVGPNGTAVLHSHDAGADNGISDITAPMSSLIGVFLDSNVPNTSPAPAPATDASHPALKQVFFIGSSSNVTVPAGATRLFLGVMDSFQWSNNPGAFNVQIGASTYHVCPLYDSTKAVNSGATLPIKLQLCDNNGNDVSSLTLTLHATSITKVSEMTSNQVQDAGNANPDSDFRFDPTLGPTGGYIFNLSTKGLTRGSYNLNFTVTGDTAAYAAPFQVK